MNRTLLLLGMFLVFVVASVNHASAQIQDIKNHAEENKKKKEEPPQKTTDKQPVNQTKVVPTQPVSETPVVDNPYYVPISVPVPVPVYNEVHYNDNSSGYESLGLGCLIPECLLDRSSTHEDCLHKIDSSFLSIDLRAHFDVGYHPSPYWHFMYIDYLPGIRINLEYFMFDFRYNILTEYTNDYPDSFK